MVYLQPSADEYQIYYQEYEKMLTKLAEQIKNDGSQLVIVAFPEYRQIPQDAYPNYPQEFIEKLASELNVPYLDLLPIFRQNGTIESLYLLTYDSTLPLTPNDPFFPEISRYTGNGHPSRYGYYIAAQAIADFLSNNILDTNQ